MSVGSESRRLSCIGGFDGRPLKVLIDSVRRNGFYGFGSDGTLRDFHIIDHRYADRSLALDSVLFDGTGCCEEQGCGCEGLEVFHYILGIKD